MFLRALIFSAMLCPGSVWATDSEQDFNLNADDSKAHVAAAFIVNDVSYIAMRKAGLTKGEALFAAAGLTMFIGAAKEVADNPLSQKDLGADAVGMLAGFVACFALDW